MHPQWYDRAMNEVTHKNMSTADLVRMLGEIEHLRRHCIISLATAPEDKLIGLLVIANRCLDARRHLQHKYFPQLEPWSWCIAKSAATLWQMVEELTVNSPDDFKTVKGLVDESILLTTGEDISGCESCASEINNLTEE